jgi:hypothetical protein
MQFEDICYPVSKLFRFHLKMFYNHKSTEFHPNVDVSAVSVEVVPLLDIWGVCV